MKEVTAWYPSYRWGSLKPMKAVVWWESHQLVAGLEVSGPQCDAPGLLPWPWQEPCTHTLRPHLTVSHRLSSLLQVRWVWALTRSGSLPPLFCWVGKRRWQRRNPDPLSAARGPPSSLVQRPCGERRYSLGTYNSGFPWLQDSSRVERKRAFPKVRAFVIRRWHSCSEQLQLRQRWVG